MVVHGHEPFSIELSGVERDGFHALEPNSHKSGMKWIWSDHFASRVVLERAAKALPDWTSSLFIGLVITQIEV